MARSRIGDPAAGPTDPRITAYLEGTHHPQQALAPRVAYLAEEGATVTGYIGGHLTRRFECDGELQYLYVAPPYRRSGVATELVRLLARWFTQQGAAKICVNANPDSPAARAFYLRLGATEINRHWFVWDDISTLMAPGNGPG